MDLKVENLKVEIDGKKIIEDISLKVESDQSVGIIGPNGCGKSTLLKSIYKYIKPTSGSVYLNGVDLIDANPKEVFKDMAVVGQFNQINFSFSVYDMVLMGRSPHKKFLEKDSEEDRQIVMESLEKVGLETYVDEDFSMLSGGEKQRVILARALAQQPKILILDEPTNHLDIKYQIEILEIVKSLNISVLSVLHDLSLTYRYCDYIYVMKEGRIIKSGRPRDVVNENTIGELYNIKSEIIKKDEKNIAICYEL